MTGADPQNQPPTQPIGVSTGESGTDPLAGGLDDGAGKKSAIPSSVGVVLLVALIAGGALVAMRQFGLGSGVALVDINIDYPIEVERDTSQREYEQVLADLTTQRAPQVALSDIRPHPFSLERQATPTAPVQSGETEEDRLARIKRQRRLEIDRAFQALELNSVLGGSSPIARVSGETVRPGDTVSDLFVVKEITGRAVVLLADGQTYTLRMGER